MEKEEVRAEARKLLDEKARELSNLEVAIHEKEKEALDLRRDLIKKFEEVGLKPYLVRNYWVSAKRNYFMDR